MMQVFSDHCEREQAFKFINKNSANLKCSAVGLAVQSQRLVMFDKALKALN